MVTQSVPTPSIVNRIRSKNVPVHWPTKKQMKKRGCTPYVEYDHEGKTYRLHLQLKSSDGHPSTVFVKIQGTIHTVTTSDDSRHKIDIGKTVVITK